RVWKGLGEVRVYGSGGKRGYWVVRAGGEFGDWADLMLAKCALDKPVVFKALKASLRAESVSQGVKPGAKTRHKKPDHQATGGPTSLRVTNEERASPQLSSDFTAEGDHRLSAPNDSIPPQQGMDEGTKNAAILHDKEEASIAIHGDKEEASSTIKLKDLVKLVSQIQPSFKDLDSPEDDPVIIVDESDEDEPNAKTKDTLIPRSLSPNSLPTKLKDLPSKFNELTKEIKGLKTQVYELKIGLPKEPKEIPTNLEDFTKTATSLTPPRSSSQPEREHIKKGKGKKVMSSEEAEKQNTKSDSDEEAYVTGSMVKSSKEKKLKKFDFIIEDGRHAYLSKEQINNQKKLEEEAKAEAAK
nr:hypothetical protein [Tanacetum cinerariifolium]